MLGPVRTNQDFGLFFQKKDKISCYVNESWPVDVILITVDVIVVRLDVGVAVTEVTVNIVKLTLW